MTCCRAAPTRSKRASRKCAVNRRRQGPIRRRRNSMRARTFLLIALALLACMATAAPFQDALRPTGTQAEHIHMLWEIFLWTCTAVFVAIVGACGIALWR